MKKNKKILLVLVIAVLTIILGVFIWFKNGQKAVQSSNGENIRVEIEEGSGSSKIAKLLEEKNVIKSYLPLRKK